MGFREFYTESTSEKEVIDTTDNTETIESAQEVEKETTNIED